MELTVHGPLRGITGKKTISIPDSGGSRAQTVHVVLKRFIERYPRAESQLFDDNSNLRGSVRVLVNGQRATPETPCPPTAEVAVIPAAQGG